MIPWTSILAAIGAFLRSFLFKSKEERAEAKFEKKHAIWQTEFERLKREQANADAAVENLVAGHHAGDSTDHGSGTFTQLSAVADEWARRIRDHRRKEPRGPVPRQG